MSGQGIVVARRGAGSEVLFRTDVVRLGEVGCVFHRHVEAIALVTPLGWGNPISWWDRGCLVVAGETDAAIVCVEVLRPSQPNGVMSSAVSLPNHTFYWADLVL